MQTSRITELESLQPTALDAGEVFSGTPSGHQVQGLVPARVWRFESSLRHHLQMQRVNEVFNLH